MGAAHAENTGGVILIPLNRIKKITGSHLN